MAAAGTSERGSVVLVVPLAPAATGNGLAMRAGMLLDALASERDVHVVVIPVSGSADTSPWARERAASVTVVEPVGPDTAREHTTRQLGDIVLEARLERTTPLPARAVLAPPTLAVETRAALRESVGTPDAVVAMRLYLAPLGIRLAAGLHAPRVIVDADDDDGAVLRSLGDDAEADAFDRLALAWLPDAHAVLAASPTDAERITRRVGIETVTVVPNVVTLPAAAPPPPPGADRILFVANLTYEPNRVAARVLAQEILPRVRERRPDATVELVGRHDGSLDDLAARPGVVLTGGVDDVTPHYAAADVVVVPLRHGGGTRIKVIEAFAHRRPVVATPTAIAGLDIEPSHHALVADSPEDLADAVLELLADPPRAAAIVGQSFELIASRYTPAVVGPLVRAAVLGASAGTAAA